MKVIDRFGRELVTGLEGPAGPGYAATSVTSLTIGTGSKTLSTQAGLAYSAGARVRLSSAADPVNNWMEGVVTSYLDTELIVSMDTVGGSGTHADWNINVAGLRGADGVPGPSYTPPSGAGSPEGVVSAPVGSTYVDTAQPALYAKTGGGSGNTGWTMVGGA